MEFKIFFRPAENVMANRFYPSYFDEKKIKRSYPSVSDIDLQTLKKISSIDFTFSEKKITELEIIYIISNNNGNGLREAICRVKQEKTKGIMFSVEVNCKSVNLKENFKEIFFQNLNNGVPGK